jgi:hypothetical protein
MHLSGSLERALTCSTVNSNLSSSLTKRRVLRSQTHIFPLLEPDIILSPMSFISRVLILPIELNTDENL